MTPDVTLCVQTLRLFNQTGGSFYSLNIGTFVQNF